MAKFNIDNVDDMEEDDMANELNYIREAYNNNRTDPFGRRLSDDELLMIGIIEE